MDTEIFTYGLSKVMEEVEEGLEAVGSVYRVLENKYNHITGNDIEIFPDYCELDEEYRKELKDRLESAGKSFYVCKGCGLLKCQGYPAGFDFLSHEEKKEVSEWKRYICRLDKERGIDWDEDIL